MLGNVPLRKISDCQELGLKHQKSKGKDKDYSSQVGSIDTVLTYGEGGC